MVEMGYSSDIVGECLYVLPAPSFFTLYEGMGGHVTHALGMIRGLQDNDWRVKVFGGDVETAGLACEAESYYIGDGIWRGSSFVSRLVWNWAFCLALLEKTRNEKPDIVYIRYATSFSPWLRWILRQSLSPYWIVEANSFLGGELPFPLSTWALEFQRASVVNANLTITVSTAWAEVIDPDGQMRRNGKLAVLPNAVGQDFLTRTKKATVDSEDVHSASRLRVAYFGIFKTSYDLEWVCQTLGTASLAELGLDEAEASSIRLDIYGEGPTKQLIERAIPSTEQYLSVQLRDSIPYAEVPNEMVNCDILLLPLSKHGVHLSPVKLFEYMASGRAILAARIGQVADILEEGKTALLYTPGDRTDFLCSFSRLVRNPSLRANIGRESRQVCLENYTYQANARTITDILGSRVVG